MDTKQLGITCETDIQKDEHHYTVGYPGHIPIALLLLIASSHKNSVARYFNIFTHTQHANSLQDKFLKQKIQISQDFQTIFEGDDDDSYSSFTKTIESTDTDFNNQNNLPLFIYAEQFAKIIAMKTPGYESGIESVVLTCPMSYIQFWNREEFNTIGKSIDTAGIYILSEVKRILTLRGIDFDPHHMTIPHPEYKGFKFSVDFGF